MKQFSEPCERNRDPILAVLRRIFADRTAVLEIGSGTGQHAAYFAPALRTGHFMFDLPGYIERRLARAGVATIERAPHDTVADDTHFFSYRRACLRGEPVYGRSLSAIALIA